MERERASDGGGWEAGFYKGDGENSKKNMEGRVRRDGWRRKTERRMSLWDGGQCSETEAVY